MPMAWHTWPRSLRGTHDQVRSPAADRPKLILCLQGACSRRSAGGAGTRRPLRAGGQREASGKQLRITAQLVDGGTGAHLWAEHFDGSVADVFAFQDRITADVAMIVGPQIQVAEIERSRRERPGSIAAYDAYLQAVPKINKETAKENAEAYALLTRALSLEPDNAFLLSHAAWALGHRSAMGWPPIGPDDVRTCVELSRRALQRAAGDPTVLAHCGLNLLQTGREYDWGMAVLESCGECQSQPPRGSGRGRHRASALRQGRGRVGLFPPGDTAQPERSGGACFADRDRPWADDPRELLGSPGMGGALACATTPPSTLRSGC